MTPSTYSKAFATMATTIFVSAGKSPAAVQFQTIDMLAIGLGNASVANIGPVTQESFPYGNPSTVGGVPFIISDSANQLWGS